MLAHWGYIKQESESVDSDNETILKRNKLGRGHEHRCYPQYSRSDYEACTVIPRFVRELNG